MSKILSHEAKRLWRYRWQIWVDMTKDLVADSRETFGKLLWVVIMPLVPMGVYLFLAAIRVFPSHEAIDGTAFVLAGALFWFLYSSLFLGPISAVKRKGAMAAKTRYPLAGVILSSALQSWFDFVVRAAFVVSVLAVVQLPNLWGMIGLVGVVFPLSLFFLGAGMIVAVFSVAWKDLEKTASIAVQYLFFLSNVIFQLPERALPGWLVWCNPFAFAIDTSRWFFMFGEVPELWLWAVWSMVGVLTVLKALHFTAISEQRLAAHL